MDKVKDFLVFMAIVCISLGSSVFGYYIGQASQKAVCHSITEDAVIRDCEYHNGTWFTK